MDESDRPVDITAWAEYAKGGRDRFDVVKRSFDVLALNTVELLQMLQSVETDVQNSFLLMKDQREPDADDETKEFHRMFWARLDQRLHNTLAAAVALVDHTRRLTGFYEKHREHLAEFLDEWEERNILVRDSVEGRFLRRFRNYLLHYGAAPFAHSINLGPITPESPDHVSILLSPMGLLDWDEWNQSMRSYIASFESGLPIRQIVLSYGQNMEALYRWLLRQYARIHVPGEVPPHLR